MAQSQGIRFRGLGGQADKRRIKGTISRGSSQPYISSVRGKTLHMHVCLFVYVCVCACAWQDSIHAYVSVSVCVFCCVCVSGKSLYMHILTCSMYFFPLYKRTRFFKPEHCWPVQNPCYVLLSNNCPDGQAASWQKVTKSNNQTIAQTAKPRDG